MSSIIANTIFASLALFFQLDPLRWILARIRSLSCNRS